MLQQTTAINSCDIHHYCSVATRILQLCTRKESFIFAICLTAASPWPRKATHGCFHIAAWYRTKSDRHVFRRILLKPKKMNRTDYRLPGTDVPTKKIKCVFQRKMNSNNPHVHIYDIIHRCEYEYFGSARTPLTKSSTSKYKRPHRVLVVLHTRSTYPTQLAKMSFDEIIDLTAGVFYFIIIAIEKPYTTARILENE